MFDKYLPKKKIGVMSPLPIIDNSAYEFYRIVQEDVMLVMIPVGLAEFSAQDVERVFAPIDSYLDKLMDRGVDLIMQSGVPLPILIGMKAHDQLIDHIAQYSGRLATSSVIGIVAAAKHLGIRRIALANKWSDKMNGTLGDFFRRDGIEVAGVASEVLSPAEFQKKSSKENMSLAYELGRAALTRFPDADGLYIGGGAWLSQPVCEALEQEFGKPTISNKSAMIWDTLHRVNYWHPIVGHGQLLASP